MSIPSDLRPSRPHPPAPRRPAGFLLAATLAAFAALAAVAQAARADGERVRPEKIPSPAGEARRREEESYRRAVERARELERLREEEAARDHARRLSEREAAEYWGGRRYEKIGVDDMPFRVRRELRELTAGTTDPDYYRFTRA